MKATNDKHSLPLAIAGLLLCAGAIYAMASPQAKANASAPDAVKITAAGAQASMPGPSDWFTGSVRVDPLWAPDGKIAASGAWVTFEPGARSAWHTHPLGQRLVVMSGIGLTQEWGKPIRVLHPGDVVVCPPGVKHWHGAGPTTAMTHLTVTGTLPDGTNAQWMEKVSDEQYSAK